MSAPAGIRPLLDLAALLRSRGFPVSPDQTIDFIAGVGVLGPNRLEDVRRAALALFAIPPERMAEFDALFRALFIGETIAAEAQADEDTELDAEEATGREVEAEIGEETEAGQEAAVTERLGFRPLRATSDAAALATLHRDAARDLPKRRSFRRTPSRHGKRIDLRRTLRSALRRDGEMIDLHRTTPRLRQRRILLLIDVSGSMSGQTPQALTLAHALMHSAERVEVFTLGTRLTRITPALRPAERARAMARVSTLVADIDGGTRIGDALAAFLAVPRFAGFARGALTVVLSDGLERGDPGALRDATRRLSRLAWRLHWLTPLAADPAFTPRTEALSALLPHLDALADGASTGAIVHHLLTSARAA